MITYREPARRVWMGPQFTFAEVIPSGHSSTDLVCSNCVMKGFLVPSILVY